MVNVKKRIYSLLIELYNLMLHFCVPNSVGDTAQYQINKSSGPQRAHSSNIYESQENFSMFSHISMAVKVPPTSSNSV